MQTIRFLVAFPLLASLAWAAEVKETDVFVAGEGGYHTYRIPAVLVTKKGTLLAFCEGRKVGRSDAGDIDLLLRRSSDQGVTWSEPQVVWNDGANTCGNPCPVVDQETGTVWLLLTWNRGDQPEHAMRAGFGEDSRRVFVSHSTDEGESWSEPKDITRAVKKPEWSWYATGPGNGIQLTQGEHRGRLVIPCDHKVPAEKTTLGYSHVIYSDDAGQTWQLGGSTPTDHCNECEVVELSAGRLLLNMRSHDSAVKRRQQSVSDDGGATWSKPESAETLIEPICQGSIRRYSWSPNGPQNGQQNEKPGILLFSNPASTKARQQLTLRASFDDGRTWPNQLVLHAGSAAYSCLTVLPNGTIGCLYEQDDYRRIVFAVVPAESELLKMKE